MSLGAHVKGPVPGNLSVSAEWTSPGVAGHRQVEGHSDGVEGACAARALGADLGI